MGSKMFEKVNSNERHGSRATILGIGTAVPSNCFYQTQYPDFYFQVANSQHMTRLKHKFNNICEKSDIKKRYLHLNEEILKANPNMCKHGAPSLDARQEMMQEAVPKLGKEAALKAIQEWGQPISNITHLIFCTTSTNSIPGPDCHLSKLLGLNNSTKKFMLFNQGCFVAGTALRLAKDLAENNPGARVLVVCVDITTICFHGPCEDRLDILVGQALFSDGAAAVIIGANPHGGVEQGLFEIVSASQALLPNTEDGIKVIIKEMGLMYQLSRNVPKYIGENIEKCLGDALSSSGIIRTHDYNNNNNYNSLFYAIHPGGRAILDEIEQKLGLENTKLEVSREVLREYGNMIGPTVIFVLDEMRKKSIKERKSTTGEGLQCGVVVTIGPGVTMETLMLNSVPIVKTI